LVSWCVRARQSSDPEALGTPDCVCIRMSVSAFRRFGYSQGHHRGRGPPHGGRHGKAGGSDVQDDQRSDSIVGMVGGRGLHPHCYGSDRHLREPVWHVLGASAFALSLAKAAHIKNVPGRKTDVSDATWLADLMGRGLRAGCSDQELRTLRRTSKAIRARAKHSRPAASEDARRCQHSLDSILSDIIGLSGRRMIETVIAGESEPDTLAGLAIVGSRHRRRSSATRCAAGSPSATASYCNCASSKSMPSMRPTPRWTAADTELGEVHRPRFPSDLAHQHALEQSPRINNFPNIFVGDAPIEIAERSRKRCVNSVKYWFQDRCGPAHEIACRVSLE